MAKKKSDSLTLSPKQAKDILERDIATLARKVNENKPLTKAEKSLLEALAKGKRTGSVLESVQNENGENRLLRRMTSGF